MRQEILYQIFVAFLVLLLLGLTSCTTEDEKDTSKTTESNETTRVEFGPTGASPDEPTLNYPPNGSTGISTSPTLNVTVTDGDGDDMNVSFYEDVSWEVDHATHDTTISSKSDLPMGVFFKPDGTKMYEVESQVDVTKIYQHTLTTPWDISTSSYDGVSMETYHDDPQGMFIKPDGTKLYEVDSDSAKIYQHTLTTPWDVSTSSYDESISTEGGSPTGIYFRSDGEKLYVIGHSEYIYQYTLGTPWDLSTASYDNVKKEIGDDGTGLFFKSDGTKVYKVDHGQEKILQYTLSTPWDISTASYDNKYMNTKVGYPRGMFIKPDGTKVYEADSYAYIIQHNITHSFLSEQNSVSDGSEVTYEWSGLNYGKTYDWFVESDDGTSTKTSDTWSFTTNKDTTPPNTTITPDGGTYISNTNFQIDCTDNKTGCEKVYWNVYNNGTTGSSTIYNNMEDYTTGVIMEPDGWLSGSLSTSSVFDSSVSHTGEQSYKADYGGNGGNQWQEGMYLLEGIEDTPATVDNETWINISFWFYETSDNTDGSFWVRACDGTNLAGIGTENPQFNWYTNSAGNTNSGKSYQTWTYAEMIVNTSSATADFYFDQKGNTWDVNGKSIPSGKEICDVYTGASYYWWLDDITISVDQENPPVSDTVTCPEGRECVKKVTYFGEDSVGNKPAAGRNDEKYTPMPHSAFFTIDKNPPENSIDSPTAGTWFKDTSGMGSGSFDVSTTDSGDDIDSCDYRIDNGNDGTYDTDWTSRTCGGSFTIEYGSSSFDDCNIEGENSCKIQIRTNDTAGNINTDSKAYSIDVTHPASDHSPNSTNGWVATNENYQINCSDQEPTSGSPSGCDNINWGEVSSGNDCSTPNTASPNVSTSTSCSDGNACELEICYNVTDVAGNTEDYFSNHTRTGVFKIDRADPTTSIDTASGWHNSDFDVSFTDSDEGSGVASCEYRILDDGVESKTWSTRSCDGSVTIDISSYCTTEGSGKCTVESRATDGAGLTGTDSNSYSIDTSPPTSSVDSLSAYQGSTSWTVSWSGSDTYTSVDHYDIQYSKNGGTWTDCVVDTTSTSLTFPNDCTESSPSVSDGDTFDFRSRAQDTLGNLESYDTSDASTTVDTSPPDSTITPDGTGGWQSSDENFDITCDDSSGSGCSTVYWGEISAGSSCSTPNSESPPVSNTVSCTSGNVCEREICYYGEDSVGNTESTHTSSKFQIDKADPSSTIDSPSVSSWQTSDFSVSATDTDQGSGLSSCEYRVDDGNDGSFGSWKSRTCDTSFTVTVGSGQECTAEGTDSCKIETRATDGVGQTNTDTRTFSIDYTDPSSSVDTLSTYQDTTSWTVSWTGTDNVDIDHYDIQYAKNGGAWTDCVVDDGSTSMTFPNDCTASSPTVSDGDTFDFRSRAQDTAGNVESYDTSDTTTTVDTGPPTTTISPNGTGGWQNTIPNYDLNCSDTGTGCNTTYWGEVHEDDACVTEDQASPNITDGLNCFSNFGFEASHFNRFLVNDTDFEIKSNKFYSGSYSAGITDSSADQAIAEARIYDLGARPNNMSFYWYETSSSHGGGLRLYDSNGNHVVSFASDNPQWDLVDADGRTQVYDGNSNFDDWIYVELDFDWATGTYDYFIENTDTSNSVSGTRTLDSATNIEKLKIENYASGWTSSSMYMWFDDIHFDKGPTCQIDVCYYSDDNAGREENMQRSDVFQIEKTAPWTSPVSPAENTWQSSDFTVDFSETDSGGTGIFSCEYRILDDGTETLGWTGRTCDGSETIDISQYCPTGNTEGSCRVETKATDNQLNVGEGGRNFSIDTEAPTGGTVDYTDGYITILTESVQFDTGTDSGSGINTSTGELQRRSATLSSVTETCGSYGAWSTIYSGTSSPYEDSSLNSKTCYQYRYKIDDKIGNTAYYTPTKTLKTDRTPNEPTLNSPTDGAVNKSLDVTLSVTVTDPDGDAMDVSFYDASDDTQIGNTQNGVADGSDASVTWTGLSEQTTYSWYAVADDGVTTNQSDTWSFTTDYLTIEQFKGGGALNLTSNPQICGYDASTGQYINCETWDKTPTVRFNTSLYADCRMNTTHDATYSEMDSIMDCSNTNSGHTHTCTYYQDLPEEPIHEFHLACKGKYGETESDKPPFKFNVSLNYTITLAEYGGDLQEIQYRITSLTEQDIEPEGQTDTVPAYKVINNGTGASDNLSINNNVSLPSGINMECALDSGFSTPKNINITKNTFQLQLSPDSSQGVWCRIDVDNPDSGQIGSTYFELQGS